MLTYDDKTYGIQEFQLNLFELYPNGEERHQFHIRFEDFLNSDSSNEQIYSLQGEILNYRSEIFISNQIDNRPPLLLLLGNPASHSVSAGMCFAFEKGDLEHRFWKLLAEAGILSFLESPHFEANPIEMNTRRKNALFELNYLSPFRIGIAVFYSLPSAPSIRKWSGVMGIRNLLGHNAFKIISDQEESRIAVLVSKFIGSSGAIISFQKDAYNRIRSYDSPTYSRELAFQCELRGTYKGEKKVILIGAPSTRYASSLRSKSTMRNYKIWLSQQFTGNL